MKVNPYALAGFTGALRTGVERFQQGKAQQAAAESEYQRQLDDENRRFQRDMGLARFRNDLAVEGDLARIGYRDQLEDRAWNPGGPIMPRGGRFAPDGGYIQEGLAGTPEAEFGGLPGTWDVAPEGREYRREREKREAQAARDQQLFTQRQQLMQMRGPRGSRGNRNPSDEPRDKDGYTPSERAAVKFNRDQIADINRQMNEIEDVNGTEYKELESQKKIYQDGIDTIGLRIQKFLTRQQPSQQNVNDPGTVEPNPADRQHPTRKLVKAVQDEIASGANPSLIQRQIDRIPDPEARAAAQLALDIHTKKLPVLGPNREY